MQVEIGYSPGDVIRCRRTLHPGRPQDELYARSPAAQNLDYVADGGARGRGYDPDGLGEGWKGALALLLEQALLLEAFPELLESQSLGTDASRLQLCGVELVPAAAFVNGDMAVDHDLDARLGCEGELARLPLEHYAAELAGLVNEGKVAVAGRVMLEVGDFASHPAHWQRFFQDPFYPGCDLGDTQRTFRIGVAAARTVV